MSDSDLKLLTEHFENLRQACDTPEKALARLQQEGLVDENGETAALYREADQGSACL